MPELGPKEIDQGVKFAGSDGVSLELHRMRRDDGPPVLLLHGASAQHETFCIPKGVSLAEFLWTAGYDVWLLDWRGSLRVTDAMKDDALRQKREELDLDAAASRDIPLALNLIAAVLDEGSVRPKQRIHVVGHCLGAAVLAQSIASGIAPLKRIGRVVLLTIGLFYESPLDGKIKSQFNVLQRLWKAGSVSLVNPRIPVVVGEWPSDIRELYDLVGNGLRPHPEGDDDPSCSHSLCNRVSFMYGVPFRHSDLFDGIHGVSTVEFTHGQAEPRPGERVRAVFTKKEKNNTKMRRRKGAAGGPVYLRAESPIDNLGVGIVAEVNVKSGSWRRGNATGTLKLNGAFGEFPTTPEPTDGEPESRYGIFADDQQIGVCRGKLSHEPAQLHGQFGGIPLAMYLQGAENVRRRWAAEFDGGTKGAAALQKDKKYIDDDARGWFESLPAVTLITGANNQLWHRDSVHRMYEWLTSGPNSQLRKKFHKEILRDYAHQDLLWGKKSWDEVFPRILKGLGGSSASIPVDEEEGPDEPSVHRSA